MSADLVPFKVVRLDLISVWLVLDKTLFSHLSSPLSSTYFLPHIHVSPDRTVARIRKSNPALWHCAAHCIVYNKCSEIVMHLASSLKQTEHSKFVNLFNREQNVQGEGWLVNSVNWGLVGSSIWCFSDWQVWQQVNRSSVCFYRQREQWMSKAGIGRQGNQKSDYSKTD